MNVGNVRWLTKSCDVEMKHALFRQESAGTRLAVPFRSTPKWNEGLFHNRPADKFYPESLNFLRAGTISNNWS